MATGATHIGPAQSGESSLAPVRLAHEPSFSLGPLIVEPALRRIAHADGREEIVEPRMMQVLVALFRARGGIISRDDLIERCWAGRIVGEDAINRVISRLRRVAETLGEGVFRVVTVTKVGYRLVLEEGVEAPPVPPSPAPVPLTAAPVDTPARDGWWANRRTMVGGTAAAVLAAAVPALWSAWRDAELPELGGYVPTAEAKRLYDEGMKVQYHALTGTSDQAEAYFRQAAAADPGWPYAWGSLAMSYRHMMDDETNVGQWRLVDQTRAAARRALQLDPDNE